MAKKASKLDDYVKQLGRGEGLGSGKEYLPWLDARKTRTRGVSSQTLGIRTARHHHGLSAHEKNFLYIAEFDSNIIDIREQFPLLPLDLAIRIAEELGITYPLIPHTNQPNIITTDYLLTCCIGNSIEYLAVSVKPKEGLKSKRDFEKQEIERTWWELLGIRWRLYLDTPEEKILAENLKWLSQPVRNQTHFEADLIVLAVKHVPTGKSDISQIINTLSEQLSITKSLANELFRTIAWKKYINLDLNYKILDSGIVHVTSTTSSKAENDVLRVINQ
jgi:hypothetical protein